MRSSGVARLSPSFVDGAIHDPLDPFALDATGLDQGRRQCLDGPPIASSIASARSANACAS